MPQRWTSDAHETVLIAAVSAGVLSTANCSKVLDAWPAHKGQAPTLSALTQQLTALKKKHGVKGGNGTSKAAAGRDTGGNRATRAARVMKPTLPAKRAHVQSDTEDDEDDEDGLKPPIKRSTTRFRSTQSVHSEASEDFIKLGRVDSPNVEVKEEPTSEPSGMSCTPADSRRNKDTYHDAKPTMGFDEDEDEF